MKIKKSNEIKDDAFNEPEREVKEMEKLLKDLSFHEPSDKTKKENYFGIEDKISILRENTNEILNSLSAREERLIRMYYGYGLNYPMEVYEIAKQFDLSEVDIRQQLSTVFRKFLKRYFFLLKPK